LGNLLQTCDVDLRINLRSFDRTMAKDFGNVLQRHPLPQHRARKGVAQQVCRTSAGAFDPGPAKCTIDDR